MGCPQNLLYGRGQKVNTAAKALPISAARPDPGRRGYAWAAVLTYSPRPFTIFRGQPIDIQIRSHSPKRRTDLNNLGLN